METVLAGGIWRIFVDPNQLENAVLNLAVNARDAMPDGGKLTIETANAHLDEDYAAARRDGSGPVCRHLRHAIPANGMTPGRHRQGVRAVLHHQAGGTGQRPRAVQVYGFVKQSNGHVKIYSEVGTGTTVKIYLPRTMDAEAAVTPQAAAGSYRRAAATPSSWWSRTIPTYGRSPSICWSGCNYHVVAASDGAAALHMLDERSRTSRCCSRMSGCRASTTVAS